MENAIARTNMKFINYSKNSKKDNIGYFDKCYIQQDKHNRKHRNEFNCFIYNCGKVFTIKEDFEEHFKKDHYNKTIKVEKKSIKIPLISAYLNKKKIGNELKNKIESNQYCFFHDKRHDIRKFSDRYINESNIDLFQQLAKENLNKNQIKKGRTCSSSYVQMVKLKNKIDQEKVKEEKIKFENDLMIKLIIILSDVHSKKDFLINRIKSFECLLENESNKHNKSIENIALILLEELFKSDYDMSWRNTYFGETTCENLKEKSRNYKIFSTIRVNQWKTWK